MSDFIALLTQRRFCMTTIKTGMVYQRTVKGPNYLCLGTAMVNGQKHVISVKNGNINGNGKSRRMSKSNGKVSIYAHSTNHIARIHQLREVDVKTVFTLGLGDKSVQKELKRILTKGVETSAELPVLGELR
jgi:hypothetical protein